VNAILPGAVDGPRIRRVIAAKAEATGISVEDMTARYTGQASLGRLIDPDDIARLAVFLAGPGGRKISGQALAVDGDTQALV
jgi:NAD(P)-dependent dehydrogenase (short-subunit alcohol dehydrogenase family)